MKNCILHILPKKARESGEEEIWLDKKDKMKIVY